MKALFINYFNVSVACCVLILVVILLRMALRRAPKALICVLWILIFLRLALPFQMQSNLSLRPSLPALTENSTGFFFDSNLIHESMIPKIVPHDNASFSFDGWIVRVDYVQIASWLWVVGVSLFLLYTIISYIRLRYRFREAVRIRDNIFVSEKVEGAILFGWLRPRIYLPTGLDLNTTEFVLAHEQAHQKRLDHWLKLLTFLCLGIHWYNPLVWVAYFLLCNDIEMSCDEAVIKEMNEEQRKEYSAALLSLGSKRVRRVVCPLPFVGENVRKRIVTVLNYRKPTIWICVTAAVMIFFVAIFFVTDPIPNYPPYYKQLVELVGQPKETVARKLDISIAEDADPALSGYYDTPIQVEYEGAVFDLELGFSVMDDKLWGFQYVGIYENDLQDAARDTVAVAKQLQSTYGPAQQIGNKRTLWLSQIDEESVLRKFENRYLTHEGVDTVSGYWQLTEAVGMQTHAYWKEVVQADYWPNPRWGLSFGLRLNAWNDPYSEHTYLVLDYATEYSAGGNDTRTDSN